MVHFVVYMMSCELASFFTSSLGNSLHRSTVGVRISESPEAKCCQDAKSDRQRLAGLDCTRNRGSGKKHGCQKSELNTVWSSVVHSVAAKQVL
jgi:hypothetical protein